MSNVLCKYQSFFAASRFTQPLIAKIHDLLPFSKSWGLLHPRKKVKKKNETERELHEATTWFKRFCWFPIPLWKVYTRHCSGCNGHDLFWSVLVQPAEKRKPDSMPAFFATAAASWPGKSIMGKDHQHSTRLEAKKQHENVKTNQNTLSYSIPCHVARHEGQTKIDSQYTIPTRLTHLSCFLAFVLQTANNGNWKSASPFTLQQGRVKETQ